MNRFRIHFQETVTEIHTNYALDKLEKEIDTWIQNIKNMKNGSSKSYRKVYTHCWAMMKMKTGRNSSNNDEVTESRNTKPLHLLLKVCSEIAFSEYKYRWKKETTKQNISLVTSQVKSNKIVTLLPRNAALCKANDEKEQHDCLDRSGCNRKTMQMAMIHQRHWHSSRKEGFFMAMFISRRKGSISKDYWTNPRRLV